MLIQDQRLRTLKSPPFNAKMNRQCKRLREQLNTDMYPFVGGSSKAQSLNAEMAEVALSLHAVLNAYSGAFEIIWPRTGDEFNSELHSLDHVERHPFDTSGRSILWVTMGGIRYKGPGKDWRTCSPARVILADRPPTWAPLEEPPATFEVAIEVQHNAYDLGGAVVPQNGYTVDLTKDIWDKKDRM